MKHLSTEQSRKILTQFALSNVLVVFDYDGTLSPIVSNRGQAPMRRRTRDLLACVCAEYPCAIISGRALSDVSNCLDGIGVRYVVGNHGLEPARRMGCYAALVIEVRNQLLHFWKICKAWKSKTSGIRWPFIIGVPGRQHLYAKKFYEPWARFRCRFA